MRRAETYEKFAATVSRDTTIERCRSIVATWSRFGLAELVGVGDHVDRWFINAARRCETPIRYDWIGRSSYRAPTADSRKAAGRLPERSGGGVLNPSLPLGSLKPVRVEGLFRCRKCPECVRFRTWDWTQRAQREFRASAVTWMGTLTLAPAVHAQVDAWVADANLWPDRSRLSDEAFSDALFRARAGIIADRVKTWVQLVRDLADLRLYKRDIVRYLLVAERHDSHKTSDYMRHRPHFHMLLHEVVPNAAFLGDPLVCKTEGDHAEMVRKEYDSRDGKKVGVYASDNAVARLAWPLGFTKFQYCEDEKAAYYVCKYMNKSAGMRPRASIGYGAFME